MNHQILLNGISVDELIARLKSELTPAAPAAHKEIAEEFLTAKQVAALLSISLVTLHKWKKVGKLNFYRFGTRIRFKKSEILDNEKYSKGKK